MKSGSDIWNTRSAIESIGSNLSLLQAQGCIREAIGNLEKVIKDENNTIKERTAGKAVC